MKQFMCINCGKAIDRPKVMGHDCGKNKIFKCFECLRHISQNDAHTHMACNIEENSKDLNSKKELMEEFNRVLKNKVILTINESLRIPRRLKMILVDELKKAEKIPFTRKRFFNLITVITRPSNMMCNVIWVVVSPAIKDCINDFKGKYKDNLKMIFADKKIEPNIED